MRQKNNDVILKVITEWEQFEISLNWDTDCKTLIHHFSNILRGMTFTTPNIIDGLREVSDELERDMKLYNDINRNVNYGTTNQEGTND